MMKASTPGTQNVRQQQASARRQQILEAAVRLFAQNGVARTTTRQIATEVGVAEGLIFKYFPTKLALVQAVTGSPHIFLGDLRKILENAKTQPVAEVMERVATVWLDLLHREADLSSIMFGEGLINPEIGGILYQVIEEGATGIRQFLDASQQAGKITPLLDTKTVTHIYMSSILMFFLRYRHLNEADWEKESAIFADNLKAAWLRMVTP
jgi:AcrR family transcriptional regulator